MKCLSTGIWQQFTFDIFYLSIFHHRILVSFRVITNKLVNHKAKAREVRNSSNNQDVNCLDSVALEDESNHAETQIVAVQHGDCSVPFTEVEEGEQCNRVSSCPKQRICNSSKKPRMQSFHETYKNLYLAAM